MTVVAAGTPVTETEARALVDNASKPSDASAAAFRERGKAAGLSDEAINATLKANGIKVEAPSEKKTETDTAKPGANSSTVNSLNSQKQPTSFSETEARAGFEALKRNWTGDPKVLEDAAKAAGVDLNPAPVAVNSDEGLANFDKVFGGAKASEYDLVGAYAGKFDGDTAALAKFDGSLRAGFEAASIPRNMGAGIASEMLDSMRAFAANKPGPAKQTWLAEQVKQVQAGGTPARTMATWAAYALAKVPQTTRDAWIKSGALDSAQALTQWAQHGERLFHRDQYVAQSKQK